LTDSAVNKGGKSQVNINENPVGAMAIPRGKAYPKKPDAFDTDIITCPSFKEQV
jgi:hypothetical protein